MNFPISGAEVQVLTGPRAGPIVASDRYGQYAITASDYATVKVSKDGFHESERSVPASASAPVVFLNFALQSIDIPVVIAAIYDMTLTAANDCTQLPGVARQRTYRAKLDPSGTGWFTANFLDGDFPYGSYFTSEVRLEPPRTLRVHFMRDWVSDGIVERIGPDMLLEIIGTIDLPLGTQSATATFNGVFAFCAAPAPNQHWYQCPIQPVTCQSADHSLAWVRQ